jgi:acyl-CoA thioesterase-1
MGQSLLSVLLTFVLLACSEERRDQPRSKEAPAAAGIIIAVGDSLTAAYGLAEEDGYPAQLETRLKSGGYSYRVVNAGVSAETSSGALSRLPWIIEQKPDIVILETGANDGLRGIDPVVLEKNLREMLRLLAENRIVVVLAGMQMVRNLGPLYVGRFNAIYPRLAKEFEVIYYPFFLEGVAMQHHLNQADGIHPNREGYAKIAEAIYPQVVKAIERREGR